MGRRTVLSGENQTLSTGNVVAVLQTAAAGSAGANIKVTRVELSQNASTTSGGCRAEFFTRDTAGTLTTTSKAPVATSPVTGAASGLSGSTSVIGGTARSGIISSADSGGTYTNSIPFNFNNLNGYLWKPDGYGEEIHIPPSTVWGVRFLATPTGSTGWTITIYLNEEG